MSVRGRRVAIFLPVFVTLVLAAVIGALVIVENQRQTDQVTAAEDIGNNYLRDVGAFRSSVAAAVNGSHEDDPGKLRVIVNKAIAHPPVLEDAPAYGVERSEAYTRAQHAEKTFMKPYRSLSSELRRADIALDFIRAARKALKLRTSDYIGYGFVDSSAPIRSQLVPAFVQARDEFNQIRVPKGQEELAATVRDAVQYVIHQATILADRIDANESFSFTYSVQFQAALDAVNGYATIVEGDVTEAINAVAGKP